MDTDQVLVAAVQQVEERFGRVDVLVNSAGVGGGGPVHLIDDGEWDRVMDINLKGTLYACQAALPGMLTGIILGMSRAVGETAPVIAISALVYLTFVPSTPLDRFTVLPIQIFNWMSRPQDDFRGLAAAGILVLLAVLISMNAIAIYLRNRYQVKSEE